VHTLFSVLAVRPFVVGVGGSVLAAVSWLPALPGGLRLWRMSRSWEVEAGLGVDGPLLTSGESACGGEVRKPGARSSPSPNLSSSSYTL